MATEGFARMTAMDAQVLEHTFRRRIGEVRFDRYFDRKAVIRAVDAGSAEVVTREPFYASWLEARFADDVAECAGIAASAVTWRCDPGAFGGAAQEPDSAEVPAPVASPARVRPRRVQAPIDQRFDLSRFVVGRSNEMAFDAASRLANSDADAQGIGLQFLFLHGPCGVGKTHLLQGTARRFRELNPGAAVRCVSGEEFTNRYIAAVQKHNLDEFRASLRGLDLLCIDDVHFIAGKDKTQAECLHTLDALEFAGGKVALASDAHPRNIDRLSTRLMSRCLAGLVVQVDLPDRATRDGIVRQIAGRLAIRLDDEAIALIAEMCVGSVREVEGRMVRLQAALRLEQSHEGVLGAGDVRRALSSDLAPRRARPVRLHEILDCACAELRVEVSEVLGRSRHRRAVLVRAISTKLAREMTTASYPEIARALGRPNHSTVITAGKRLERQLAEGELCQCPPELVATTIADMVDRVRVALAREQRGAA